MRKVLHRTRVLCRRRVFAEMLEVRCLLSASGLTAGQSGFSTSLLQGTMADPAMAPDGSLWYIKNNALERLSVDGQITTFAMPSNPGGIPQPVISSVSFFTSSTALVVLSGAGNQSFELPVDGQFADAGSPADSPVGSDDLTTLLYAGGGVIVNAAISMDALGSKEISPEYINSLVSSGTYASSLKVTTSAGDSTGGQTQGPGTQPSTPPVTGPVSPAPPVQPIAVVPPATMAAAVASGVKLEIDAPAVPPAPASVNETAMVTTTQAAGAGGENAPAAAPGEKFVPTESGASSEEGTSARKDDPGTFAGEFSIVARGAAPTNHGVPPAKPSQMYSSGEGTVNVPEAAIAKGAGGTSAGATSQTGANETLVAAAAGTNGSAPAMHAGEGGAAAAGDGQAMSRLNGYMRLWRAAACLCVATGLQLWNGGTGRRFFVWARRRSSN